MTELARWLEAAMAARGLSQAQTAVYAGVGQATISSILQKRHIPRLETLWRLADYFAIPRAEMLCLAGHLPSQPEATAADANPLEQELCEQFRALPHAWQLTVLAHLRGLARLAGGEGEGRGAASRAP
jgi:transcriptional regulator with XRE-family HTH domain